MASSVNYQLKLCPPTQHGKTHPAESSARAEIAASRVASGFAPSYARNGIFSATRKRKFGKLSVAHGKMSLNISTTKTRIIVLFIP
jgi:hypothetical protein